LILARPGADLRIALLPFLQTKTNQTALTTWPVWARDCGEETGVVEAEGKMNIEHPTSNVQHRMLNEKKQIYK
jgi:hypothetical protein